MKGNETVEWGVKPFKGSETVEWEVKLLKGSETVERAHDGVRPSALSCETRHMAGSSGTEPQRALGRFEKAPERFQKACGLKTAVAHSKASLYPS